MVSELYSHASPEFYKSLRQEFACNSALLVVVRKKLEGKKVFRNDEAKKGRFALDEAKFPGNKRTHRKTWKLQC